MSSEEKIRQLEKKHTKRSTGSLHQTELKSRAFLNELIKQCQLKDPSKYPTDAKKRMQLQRLMQENSALNQGRFYGSAFNVEGFIVSFEKDFVLTG